MENLIIAGVILTAGLGGLAWWLRSKPEIRIGISQTRIQSVLDAQLPIEGEAGVLSYRIGKAAVSLREDGRVAMDMAVEANLLKGCARGSLIGSGVLDCRDGAFYLKEFDVENVALDAVTYEDAPLASAAALLQGLIGKVPASVATFVSDGAESLAGKVKTWAVGAMRAVLDGQPIHRLDTKDAKQAVARLVLRKVEVVNGALVVTLDPLTDRGRSAAIMVLGALTLATVLGVWIGLSGA